MKKDSPFRIKLSIDSMKDNKQSINTAIQEVHKLIDTIWEKYPSAQVASQKYTPKGKSICFEVI